MDRARERTRSNQTDAENESSFEVQYQTQQSHANNYGELKQFGPQNIPSVTSNNLFSESRNAQVGNYIGVGELI